MDWNDLRYFLAVARAGTLAGAARALGVEHTTVGRRLAALETALGVRLLTRGPSSLLLTPAGTEILRSVAAIAEHVEHIERRVANSDARIAGTVRLTVPESGNKYFVQQLTALRERHPDLTIELLAENRALDLRRGEADVAVRLREIDDPLLVVRKIGHAGWALYGTEAYLARKGPLLAPEALRGHDLIGFDASLSDVIGALWLREHGKEANVVLRGNNLDAVASAVAAGLGLGALPCFSAAHDPTLIRLSPELIGGRNISIAVHPDLARVARVRATIDFLVELFARDAVLWSGRQAP